MSALRTVVGPTLMIIVTSMAGYVLTRERMNGVKALRRFFVFTM